MERAGIRVLLLRAGHDIIAAAGPRGGGIPERDECHAQGAEEPETARANHEASVSVEELLLMTVLSFATIRNEKSSQGKVSARFPGQAA
jgi:hypothetical protein